MAMWKVGNTHKKTVEETFIFQKGEAAIIYVNRGWRWAQWDVETHTQEPPKTAPDFNDMEDLDDPNVVSVELDSTEDECWMDLEFSGVDADEEQRLRDLVYDEGMWWLEDEEGWQQTDYYCSVSGPLTVEAV
jgi:hypothetical protein